MIIWKSSQTIAAMILICCPFCPEVARAAFISLADGADRHFTADLGLMPGVDPDAWIDDKVIYHVRHGQWANAITVSTMGGRIVRKTIHGCEQFGIEFTACENGPGVFTPWLYDSTSTKCAAGAINSSVLPRKNKVPGANPNRPPQWYEPNKILPTSATPGAFGRQVEQRFSRPC